MKKRRTSAAIKDSAGPIARFVREERKTLGYTQEDFAVRVGVGLRFLKDLELGKRTLRLDKVNQVLAFLGHELVPAPVRSKGDS